jgi:xanthine dehydrogenase accessory factor
MWNWVSALAELRARGEPVVAVTVTRVTGSAPREAGAKMLVTRSEFQGTIGGGHLEALAIEEARRRLEADEGGVERYPLGARTGQCCGGVVELLFETLGCGPRLYLFGAGHVAQAICRILAGTPFQLTVVDEREEWLRRTPEGVARFQGEWDEFASQAAWDSRRTYVAIMTHRHDLDLEIVAGLLDKPSRYLGLIGSASKWARFRGRLDARGVAPERYARLRCPIGLPLGGGKAPQEVAISLASELLRLHYEAGPARAPEGVAPECSPSSF